MPFAAARALGPALLLLTSPVAARAGSEAGASGLRSIAAWTSDYSNAFQPVLATLGVCGPKVDAAAARIQSGREADAALADLRDCGRRYQIAQAEARRRITALRPLAKADERLLGVDSSLLRTRSLTIIDAGAAYLSSALALADAARAKNVDEARRHFIAMRRNGTAMLDGQSLLLNAFRGSAPNRTTRALIDYRLLLVDAVRTLATADPMPAGLRVGTSIAQQAAHAKKVRTELVDAWRLDRPRLMALAGQTGSAVHRDAFVRIDGLIRSISSSAEMVERTLAAAPTGVLSPADATKLANVMARAEADAVVASGQVAAAIAGKP